MTNMQISNVLTGLAVADIERVRPWYETFFGRPADAEPMPGLTEWRHPGGTIQLVADERRAGGSLATLWVADAQHELAELAARGGPRVDLDTTTSDKVLFATVTDPDGNALTIVEVRPGTTL